MADSVVSSIVSFALDNLSRLLVDEVNLLSGVKDDITSLRNDLRFMAAFLKNSEGKRSNELVREMVNQIREVAFQSEDAIDMYVVNVARHKSLNKLRRCFHCVGHVAMLHEVNDQVKAIKSTLEGIYKNKTIYGIDEIDFKSGVTERAGAEYLHRRRRDVEEKEVVGLVNESTVVIQKLREPDPNLNVISIIGMGGLGKTTLAKKLYNKDEVKSMFGCCAWSYVSDDYIIRDLLLSLLKYLKSSTDECKDLSVEELKEKLSECLKGKKYLVVLDDIWKTQVWDELRGAFPNDRNGSRIIITSRLREVALYSKASFLYDLPFLDEEVNWKLFSKKIFGDEDSLLGKTLQCLNKLRTLKLIGISVIIFDPNVLPTSLIKISMKSFSEMDSRVINALGQLPNLQILKLSDGTINGDVNCKAGEFPQLQVLDLFMCNSPFPGWNREIGARWKRERGAMPNIQRSSIPPT